MRRAVYEDAEKLTALTEATFGVRYTFVWEVQEFLQNPDNLIFVEERDGQLAAAICYLQEPKEKIMEDMAISEADYDRIAGDKPALHYKYIAVDEAYQKQGIGDYLSRETLRLIDEEKRFGAIFTMFWVKDEHDMPMEHFAQRFSYQPLHYLKSPWWKYADRTCSLCGGRCKCDAYIYYRTIG